MTALTLTSPAKINLFLAVVGRRADGFHDLVSVVSPVAFGDTLTVESTASGDFTLECDDASLVVDERNLVLRAARAFREAAGWPGGGRFRLTKRIPQGAGLGGGSSNATTTLMALNTLAGRPLGMDALAVLAARLGSDCPLFLHSAPLILRGRGERIELLPETGVARLRNRRVWLFKPAFGIDTPWAFRRLAALAPGGYLVPAKAEERLAEWIARPDRPAEKLLFNTLESVSFEKYIALPVLVNQLREMFDLVVGMSGSGSTCFAFVPDSASTNLGREIRDVVMDAWGPETFFVETSLASDPVSRIV